MLDGKQTISLKDLQKKWQWQKALLFFLKILSCIGLFFIAAQAYFGFSFLWLIPALTLAAMIVFKVPQYWKLNEKEIALFLNANYNELEESAELLLLPKESGNILEQIQIGRVQLVLNDLPILNPLKKQWKLTLTWVLGLVFFGFFMWMLKGYQANSHSRFTNEKKAIKEKGLPGILRVQVKISPPSYTGKQERMQSSYSITAQEGASIEWVLETDASAKPPVIVLNDSNNIVFQPINALKTKWRISQRLSQNALYQIKWNNQLSTHYQLELIKDLLPVVTIQQPKQYTVIDYGMPLQVPLLATIKDDYGLVSSHLSLTIASGGGEAVKFKEQMVNLATPTDPYQLELAIKHQINLQLLKMQPGDELYFYIKALDNHQQETRSDIHIISLADTAALMELDVNINSLSLKPEFFRSQRQIIIETEQLLRDKEKISVEAFKEKSNELGVDQKLLRLRYGKFLGEESETNIGDSRLDTDGDHGGGQAVFGDATSIMDAFSHKHDNAEDASFFDPQTKKELKAVLNEMWGSELRLRTYFPKEALPYEYKALRLLKELQQQSRAYVAKTSQKTTALKFEKRLTGDLSKIVSPLLIQEKAKEENPAIVLRKSMGILIGMDAKKRPDAGGIDILKKTFHQLNQQAIIKPSMYLLPFEAMRRILLALETKNTVEWRDQQLVLIACEKLLTVPNELPSKKQVAGDGGLSDHYFHRLNSQEK